jgi:hypothetical protein
MALECVKGVSEDRVSMDYQCGMWVRNPKQSAWGVGEVVGIEDDKVKVLFSEVGEKNLVTRLVTLEEVPAPADAARARPRLRASRDVDMVELERLCDSFHKQFKDRRSNTDDGGMALKVLEDMRISGDLTRMAARRLFHWCHTGESYTEGVDLAQQICRVIYGRVPTPAELEAAGLL